METTFGKTVETRLLANPKPKKPNFDINQTNKHKVQYQHEYLPSRNTIQPCYTSILTRKAYKHLIPPSVGGYASDSECCSRPQVNLNSLNYLPSPYDMNNNYNYNLIKYSTDCEEDDVRSCVSMRTRQEMSQSYYNREQIGINNKQNRYKSLDRQSVKFKPQFGKQSEYLTWKNFNPVPTTQVPSLFEKKHYSNKFSLSTPATPCSMPRNRLNLLEDCDFDRTEEKYNLNFETEITDDEQFEMIALKQKEIELQLKHIENLKQKKLLSMSSSSSNTKNVNNIKSSLRKSNHQMQVMSLENALVNMNEILKNLTLNAQKKENVETKRDSISPPLSTSTSISFSSENRKLAQLNSILEKNAYTSTNISPTSFSSASSTTGSNYSNSSIESASFSPSSSSCSASSSITDNAHNLKSTENSDECKKSQQQQQQHMSFRKRLKKFLFLNTSLKRN